MSRRVQVLPVGLLTSYVREVLEGDPLLGDVWVEGEVSNLFVARSGHVYFTIGDAEGQLKCALFKPQAARQRRLPRQGDQVAAHGRVSLYERDGAIQLYVDVVERAGVGILALRLEQLRQQLEAEGLFDPARKRPLPGMPRAIGVVTSPAGAVWHDIQNVLRRRYPLAELVLAPSPVQGPLAAASLVAALAAIQADPSVDVVILARGGGSDEDLAAFNDEALARAVFASRVPVVTGVGHETDWTLVDWVADLRAPTPSAAAEIASPSVVDLADQVRDGRARAEAAVLDALQDGRGRAERLSERLARVDPQTLVAARRGSVASLVSRLGEAGTAAIRERRDSLGARGGLLWSLEPARVLGRGYAVVAVAESELAGPVMRPRDVRSGQRLVARVAGGTIAVVVVAPADESPAGAER